MKGLTMILSINRFSAIGGLCLSVAVLNFACSGSGGSSAGNSQASLSSFSAALAEEMVLSSPTAQRTSVSLLSRLAEIRLFEGAMSAPAADDSPAEKKDALETLLAATAPSSCAIALTLQNSARANCYGPSVNYTDHEHDSSSGSWPGGDLGIWETSEASGEACIASQLTSQMKGAISYIDMAQFIGAGIACVANKNSQSLPVNQGDSLDLTSSMAGIVTIDGQALTVSAAEIARASNVSGNPVYITALTGTAGTKTFEIRIKHVSTSSDDSTNQGKISVKVSNTSPNATDGISLQYEKASKTSGKMLLKKINFGAPAQDPFVSGSDYTVDYSKGWNNNADYFLAEIDPTTYAGKFSYAWQAGNGDSHTRVFNVTLSESGGSLTGSGFFGFGPTMQTGPGSIAGMICNWTGPAGETRTVSNEVQRQDIALSSGKFSVTGTSYTVFDPVADCEAGAPMSMNWNGGASTRTAASTTKNLRPIAEVASTVGTLPTAPVNVD